MAFKIGVITKNISFFEKLDLARKNDPNFNLEMIKSLNTLNQVESLGGSFNSFLFDSSLTAMEILSLGKHIKGIKKYQSSLIFLAFDDFQIFQAITTNDNFSKAKIINMPCPPSEIYLKVIADIKQLSGKTTQKNNDAQFLNIFIDCTVATIKEMSSCKEVKYSAPALLDYSQLEAPMAIRGKLSITSPFFTGSFFISFPEKTYLNLCTKVLLEETTQITKDNEDLVSELCNIVFGKSKVLLAKLDMPMGMVIPTHNRDPKIVTSGRVLIVKFTTELGSFLIKVAPGLT